MNIKQINELANKYNIKPVKYEIKGKTTLITTSDNKFAVKEKNRESNKEIINYLASRNFNYYPEKIVEDDDYIIYEGIDEIYTPVEQKLNDIVDVVALLHNKTTHYKEVDISDYRSLYEDLSNNVEYLYSYYDDHMNIIDSHEYMMPSEYLFARNSNKVFNALNYCKDEIDNWYNLVKTKRKQRFVVLHNNLDLSHFIKSNNSYLISWDKTKIGLPIFDIYKLYKRQGIYYEFEEVINRYNRSYPLLEEERKLLYILMAMPDKIEFAGSEYEKTNSVNKFIENIIKAEKIISSNYSEKTKNE